MLDFLFNQIHEFLPCLRLVESPGEVGSGGDGILLLHPAHLHAHVACLDNHHDAERIERLLDALLDLQGHALLHLEAVGEDVHHAGNLAQPRDVAVGDVGDVRFAVEGQHMVLAEGEEIDVLHDDHLVVVFAEFGGEQHFVGVHGIAGGEGQHRLGNAFGGLQQALARGVFAQQGEDAVVMFFQFVQVGGAEFLSF